MAQSLPDEQLLIEAAARALSARRHAGRRWTDLDPATQQSLRGDAATAFDTFRPYLAEPYAT